MDPAPRKARRGRPTSAAVDRALTGAALQEFVERGYRAMSMESIAARAGVSKVSLYRRWSSKLAVAADVFRLMREMIDLPDNGSLEADIRSLIRASIGSSAATSNGKILMRTMGEISGEPELMGLYREHLFGPRLELLRGVVERARARNELRQGMTTDLACAMIAGPLFLYYLALLAEEDVDLSGDIGDQLVGAILGGIGR